MRKRSPSQKPDPACDAVRPQTSKTNSDLSSSLTSYPRTKSLRLRLGRRHHLECKEFSEAKFERMLNDHDYKAHSRTGGGRESVRCGG